MFFTLPPLTGLTGAFKHGERQVWAVKLLKNAIAAANLSDKEAAAIQDLSHPQWSRQCQNVDGAHISYQRVFEFPAKVLLELAKSICSEFDVVCIEQKDLQRQAAAVERIAAALEAREQLAVAAEEQRRIA